MPSCLLFILFLTMFHFPSPSNINKLLRSLPPPSTATHTHSRYPPFSLPLLNLHNHQIPNLNYAVSLPPHTATQHSFTPLYQPSKTQENKNFGNLDLSYGRYNAFLSAHSAAVNVVLKLQASSFNKL